MQISQSAIGWFIAGCFIIPSIALFFDALLPNKNKTIGTHEQHSQ